jgi:hypothetical protein
MCSAFERFMDALFTHIQARKSPTPNGWWRAGEQQTAEGQTAETTYGGREATESVKWSVQIHFA